MAVDHSGSASQGRMRGWLESFLAARPLLFRVVGRIVRPDEIEDIVQETFINTYTAARNQKIHNPRAFMVKTARNLALNYIDRSDRKLRSSLDDMVQGEGALSTETLESQCQSEEKFVVFCRAVAELPINCRRVFILKKVYGLSQKEIADYLAISPSTVEKHVAKGMLLSAQYMLKNGHQIGPKSRYNSKNAFRE